LIIIETNLLLTLFLVGFIYLIFNLFISSISGFTWFFDWVSRIDVNDSFINSFNFFWTTFLYLPSFFFLIFLTYLLSSSLKLTKTLYLFLILLFLFYNIEILDFLILNLNLNINDLNISSLNLLLTNNLNKYHPFIFYTSVILFLNILLLNLSLFFNKFQFIDKYLINYSYSNIHFVLIVNLLALFLGSWWALQEGTWGGWWNWDPSEVLGLLFTFSGLLYLHSVNNYWTKFLNLYRLIYIVAFTVFSYLFIQLNFDLVSHNFGSKFFFFFNNNLFFLELLVILFLSHFWFLLFLQVLSNTNIIINYLTVNTVKRSQVWMWILLLYFIFSLLILTSFVPLINYFMWIYFHINSFNFIININFLIISLILIILVPFVHEYQRSWLLLYILILFHCQSLILTFILLLVMTFSFSSNLHTYIILMIISNILSYQMQFIYWYTVLESSDIIYGSQLLNKITDIYICNNFFIDKINYSQSSSLTLFNTWNVFYNSNNTSLNSFNLIFDTQTFVNIYNLSVNWQNSSLFIETNYLNNLLETLYFVWWIVITWWYYKNHLLKPIKY